VRARDQEIPLSPKERKKLDAEGYLVREGIFTREECEALNTRMLRMIEEAAELHLRGERREFRFSFADTNDKAEVFWDLSQGSPMTQPASAWHKYVQRIGHGLHLVEREFRDFCHAPAVVRLLEEALEPPVKIVLSVVVYKQPNQAVGNYPWHQDGIYVRTEPFAMCNTFIALDDMTLENGCLYVAPGSHRLGLEPHPHLPTHLTIEDISPTYEHRSFEASETVALEIPQGSVVILPGRTYHASSVNRSNRVRRALLFDSVSSKTNIHPQSFIHEPPEGWTLLRSPAL
jgi:phytanoyl-CoA hydroxylase